VSARTDDGISLVEVVITMLLLALLSLAVLPLMIEVTQRSVENRTTLAATAYGRNALAKIQSGFSAAPGVEGGRCTDLLALASPAPTSTPAATPATVLRADIDVGLTVCPSVYPVSVPVVVTVYDGEQAVTSFTSRVRVGSQ